MCELGLIVIIGVIAELQPSETGVSALQQGWGRGSGGWVGDAGVGGQSCDWEPGPAGPFLKN